MASYRLAAFVSVITGSRVSGGTGTGAPGAAG
jgi:hypothetical protein